MEKANVSPQNKRQWIITLTTIAVLGAGFAYYFLGYVKVKEASLSERAFRILSLLGSNIESKIDIEVKKFENINVEENSLVKVKSAPGTLMIFDVIAKRDTAFIKIDNLIQPLLRKDLFQEYLLMKDEAFDSLNNISRILHSDLEGFNITNQDSLLNVILGFRVSTVKDLNIGGVSYSVFLQPYRLDNINESWLIGGLIKKSNYRAMSMGVSPTIIMLIFLGTALSLLSIPHLKLLVMSPLERLGISDVTFTTLSTILGSSVVVIILLHSYRSNVDDDSKRKSLQSFTQKVSQDFLKEITVAYQQLEEFDQCHERYTDSLKIAKKYPLLRQVFWIDSLGVQNRKWVSNIKKTGLYEAGGYIPLKGRKYFSDNLNEKSWRMGNMNFTLQSIYSWTIGQSMMALGKLSESKMDSVAVVAMSSIFYSVIDPIVPLGYSYVIIDEEGLVWLHSDKSRNMQEDFIVETDNNPNLESAIYARIGSSLELDYIGKRFNGYIEPIGSLPLYIVGIRDQEYDRTLRAQTLNFTLLHTFLFFGFFIALAILSRVLRFPESRIKKTRLLYSWIWPLEKNFWAYLSIVIINTLIILLLLAFTDLVGDEQGISMLYSASIYCFLFTFLTLDKEAYGKGYIIRNSIFAAALVIIILIIIFYSLSNDFKEVIIFQGLMIAVYFLSMQFLRNVKKKQNRKWMTQVRVRLKYRNVYNLMLLTWLFIISIVPSVLFYRVSYNLEDKISVKHEQLDMAQKIAKSNAWRSDAREDFFKNSVKDYSSKHDLQKRGDIHAAHLFEKIDLTSMPDFPIEIQIDTINSDYIKIDTIEIIKDKYAFNKVISKMVRPFYNKIVIENNDLVSDMANDKGWWWKDSAQAIQLIYSNHLLPKDSTREALILTSLINPFSLPLFDRSYHPGAFLFWLLFILIFVFGLYHLIAFATKSIFIQLPLNANFSEIDRKLFKKDKSGKNIFLIGLPHSGKTVFLDKMYPEGSQGLYVINLIDVYYKKNWESMIKGAMDNSVKVVLVNYFEYNLGDKDLTTQKLQLLEQLMLFPKKKIVVSTSVHLTNIEELYSSDGVIDEDDKAAIYRWTELFKNFYEVYFPLQGIGVHKSRYEYTKNPSSLINELITEEFAHGDYLRDLRPEIIRLVEHNERKGLENDHDQIIMKTKSLSAVYYHSLWSTCTENEKYVIYDLAEDGLVNAKNVQTIEVLMNKGLIVYKDLLRVMNESFRNFILTKIGPADALKMEKKAKESGTWGNFRSPIIIILLAVGAFLLVTQRDSLSSFFSFLTPFIAIVPALIRVSMMISNRKSKAVGGGGDD